MRDIWTGIKLRDRRGTAKLKISRRKAAAGTREPLMVVASYIVLVDRLYFLLALGLIFIALRDLGIIH